jgi:choline dehydrogenase-like flavoprotein
MANINLRAKQDVTYDAIVIGSGISGGWAAKELCENGLRTLVLERGRIVNHVTDYPTMNDDPWDQELRGSITPDDRIIHYKGIRSGFIGQNNKHFYANDLENPYTEVKPFLWIRAHQMGGRSLLWGRQCYRWSDLDFEANARDGHGVDWPIRYKDLEPWYTYVEKFAGISGEALGLPQLPDSHFLPAMELNCLEKHVKSRIETEFPGRNLIIGRVAHVVRHDVDRVGPGRSHDRSHRG